MKSLFILLFTLGTLTTSSIDLQETETAVATYIGNEDGEYLFAQGDEKMAFQAIEAKAAALVNLDDKALVGRSFTITFTSEDDEDENGEAITVKTIVSIVPAPSKI